ncbi:RNA pseudouridylate synthase domain-containing protein 2 [Alosa sapidissima]|uniref:RNA pseudouridylate synthase domain-containing protein 2 n=1 Tax=Alosa sapidissima TaxID=34773 RepID=UPI001C0A4279|nr:RNA pseudouridylate synthase domain-containing protein 2 [Alosa sapidissima]
MHVSLWGSVGEVVVYFRNCLQLKELIYTPIYAVDKLVSSYTLHTIDILGSVVKRGHVSDLCRLRASTALLAANANFAKEKGLHLTLDVNNDSRLSSRSVNKVGLFSNIHSAAIDAYTTEPREINLAVVKRNRSDPADDRMDQDVKEIGEKRKCENSDNHEKTGRKRRRGQGGKQLRPGERYVPPPQKRNPGVSFSQEHFDETSYYFDGGLRKVRPYYYDFKTYCKGRWIGKTLLEVFSSEFRAEPLEYYQKAAKAGRIRLNDTPVDDLNIILKNNDLMKNTVHRHEPPVVGHPIEIIEENDEVVVVDKPASLPVHPCGRFRHNTVIFILGKERGLSELHTVHRLDRLTSGVLLFARTLEVSKRLDQMVRDRELEKEYVCRVEGEFPEEELVCEEPILVVSFKVGVCRVDPKGKPSRTVFQRISWNGHSSVVRCRPVTGRTHQIRVHLQYLGYPILNDPVYGSSAWGPGRAKGGLISMTDEELLEALVEEHRSKESLHLLDLSDEDLKNGGKAVAAESAAQVDTGCESNQDGPSDVPRAPADLSQSGDKDHKAKQAEESEGEPVTEIVSSGDTTPLSGGSNAGTDPLCRECKLVRPDPTEKELVMYLHALRYKGPDFDYSTCMPDWAKEDWVEDE